MNDGYRYEIKDRRGTVIESGILRSVPGGRRVALGDRLLIPDNLRITAQDVRTGEIEERTVHNIVTNAGMNLLRDFLRGETVTGITHLAVGTGTTAASSTDTVLGAEVVRGAVASLTAAAQKLTVAYTLAAGSGNGNNLTEAGLFNASSSGTMYARATHTAIAKTSAKTVTYTWELTWV